MRRLLISLCLLALLAIATVGIASADSNASINFESGYSNGSPHGQNGWSKSGPYDVNVVDVSSYPAAAGYGFGTKALQSSNYVVSGSFGDQAFTPALSTPASESGPTHFGASFEFGTTSTSQQPGLYMSISPDDGTGGRMSYLRFEDQSDGVHVFFDDVTDAGPLPTAADFSDIDIATLTRGAKHTVRFSIDLVTGPANDVVKIYIDGSLKHTGTTWEDYYRYDPEQTGGGNVIPTTSRLEIREGGGAAPIPSLQGQGFLLDNFNYSDYSTALCTTDCYVDATTGSDTNSGSSTSDAFKTIGAATDQISTGGTIHVAAGTYVEDVAVNKTGVTLHGAGYATTTISGAKNGGSATVQVGASGVVIDGFTITREGNNTTDWNDPGLNTAGVAVQGMTNSVEVRNNKLTGNRTGIDINNSNGSSIHNNLINDNRTGLILRNQTDNLTVTQNEIKNNWTDGVLFLDGSGGTNTPPQQALNSHFNNNDISGNWYGQVVDRQTGGSLPAPGTNLKDFSANWWGTTSPVFSSANSTEPGYAAQIPVEFGGSATPPGGQPDVLGPASANLDYSPYLNSGTDTNVSTGFGTVGFQGSYNVLDVPTKGAQTGSVGRIQEAADLVTGTIVKVQAGTLNESDSVNHTIDLRGAQYEIPVIGRTLADASESTINGQLTLNAANIKVDGFSVTNHVSIDSSAIGIVIKTVGSGAAITNNMLGNILADFTGGTQAHGEGIYLENGPDSVTITDNLLDGIHGWASSQAIYVGDSSASNASTAIDIENNTIKNVTSDAKGAYGIMTNNAAGAALTIAGNTLDGLNGHWAHAIAMEGPTTSVDINHNTVSNVTDTDNAADQIAVFFESDAPFVAAMVNDNSLAVGNDRYGVVNTSPSGTFDATCNWWGDAAGPNTGTGSDTYGVLTVAPWRTTSDLDSDCAAANIAVGTAASDALNTPEGTPISINGTFTGSVASITADNGVLGTFTPNALLGTWTWDYTPDDNYAGTTINVTGHGSNGSTAVDSFSWSSTNVNPTASGLTAPASAAATHSFNISLAGPSDVSTVDAASLHFAFDCGSGYGTHIDYATSTSTNSASCSSSTPGPLTVKGKVFDKDGGSNEYTASVTINALCTTDCYVDTTTGNDGNGGASPADALKTIQAGVTAVNASGTVHVAAGTYAEHVVVTKTLTLLGANNGTAGTATRSAESIIDGGLTDAALRIAANDVTVNGFKITRGANGTYSSGIHDAGNTGSSILNNVITGNSIGVFANCAGDCLVQYNLFDANNEAGPSGGAGLYSDSSNGLTIDSNTFTNHTQNNPLLFAATGVPGHTNLTVTNNTLNNDYGIYALAIAGGTFSGNDITATYSGGATALGFASGNSDVTVTGNTIHDSARGVRIEDDGYGFGNNSDLHINDNAITGNTSYGINVVNGYTGTLDAECNWYGNASGPTATSNPSGTGDDVIGVVDFVPWRLTSTLTGDCSTNSVAVGTGASDALNTPEGTPISINGTFTGSVASITADNGVLGTFTPNALLGTWTWAYTPDDNYAGHDDQRHRPRQQRIHGC